MAKTQEKSPLKTAESIVKTSLALQHGDKFLIITDVATYPIGHAFFDAGLKVGA